MGKRPTDIRRKRLGASLRAAVAVALAAGVLAAANALSSRLYARWRTGALPALSERTQEVLRDSTGTIEAVAVFEYGHPFRDAARQLLEEFSEAAAGNEGLSFRHRAIDVNHDIGEAADLFRRHPELTPNSILFSNGVRTRAVDEYELADESGTRFDGERACALALLRLAHPVDTVVHFLSGHGEYDPASRHPVTGASAVARALEANGFSVRPLVFEAAGASVPADCRLVVVAGPRTVFPQRDRELLASFLADGGRLLLLADEPAAAGLAPLLELWGLRLEPPPDAGGRSAAARRSTLLYGDHPSMRRMAGVLSVFTAPCGLSETDAPGSSALPPAVSRLVSVEDPDGTRRCVAAAAEAARSPRGDTRIVVFGDSDFVSNALLDGGFAGNALLLLSAVDWLAGANRPVVAGDFGGAFEPGIGTDRDWHRLGLALVLGVPAAVLAFGLLVWVPLSRLR